MKKFVLFIITILFITYKGYSQQVPLAMVADKTEGEVTIKELLAQDKIKTNQPDLVIVFFSISYPVDNDDVVELISLSDKITDEMKQHIQKLKPGTVLSFENIKVKRGSETIILQAVNLKIKD